MSPVSGYQMKRKKSESSIYRMNDRNESLILSDAECLLLDEDQRKVDRLAVTEEYGDLNAP